MSLMRVSAKADYALRALIELASADLPPLAAPIVGAERVVGARRVVGAGR